MKLDKYDEGLPLKVVRTPFGYIEKKNEDHRFINTQGQLTRPVVPDLLEWSKTNMGHMIKRRTCSSETEGYSRLNPYRGRPNLSPGCRRVQQSRNLRMDRRRGLCHCRR